MSDIDTAAVDSLKVLDPNRPIREADIAPCPLYVHPTALRFHRLRATIALLSLATGFWCLVASTQPLAAVR